ncbi:3'-5' exonuclease [Nocardia sp. CA-290969]|uniref:3'-5' exonuclease n=1 Tax=Nocardia sp. CA-290969 TaxID=3239986 RepID=UPI003D9214EE
MSAPIVFIDTETTHLHPDLRRPWEIAMIRRPALRAEDRITILIDDVDLSDADPESLAIGRFDERHISSSQLGAGARPPRETIVMPENVAAEYVYEWTRGAHLVGIVPDFDALTLDRMLRRHGLLPRWYYHLIDAETLAAGWLLGRGHLPQELPWQSEAVSRACGVEPPSEDERHTAMGDALWAQRLYDRIAHGGDQ